MTTKLIIFDLDGTLLYTLEDLKNSVNYALKCCNLPTRTLEEVRNFVGNGIYKLIERAVGDKKEYFKECFKIFKEHYDINCNNNTRPYEDIIEVLEKLKKKNIYLAILSNKAQSAVKTLSDIYFKGLIDYVQGQNDNFKTKPDPKSTCFIIEKFNVKKEETIFIGDSEVDILTAKNAGIKCISVSWGYKSREFLAENNAEIIIDNPKEIFNFL